MKLKITLLLMTMFIALSAFVAIHHSENDRFANNYIIDNIEALSETESSAPDPGACGTRQEYMKGESIECGNGRPSVPNAYIRWKYECTTGSAGTCKSGYYSIFFGCTTSMVDDTTIDINCRVI